MNTNVVELLGETAAELCRFLEECLPSLDGDDWWTRRVLDELSVPQRRFVEQNGVTSLGGLDLAALLRILYRNLYELGWKMNFPPDARHFVKEMQAVRNRWAHLSVQEHTRDDVDEDLEILSKFIRIISASDDLQNKVKSARESLKETVPRGQDTSADSEKGGVDGGDSGPEFVPGQPVRLISEASRTGAVMSVQKLDTETRYQVFIDGMPKWFYASQLEGCPSEKGGHELVPMNQFHAHLTARQIQHPSLSALYSLNAARVDFIPYQFRPVLKFIRADRPRLLIADGVGVGKTIEAGLILRELQARREIRSVLIVCPRPLVVERKWLTEMKRFEERFTQLDGRSLRFCISEADLEGEWPEQHAKTIVPYSLFDEASLHGTRNTNSARRSSRKLGLLELDPPPRFDLVIVDEAHHVRNPDTYAHEAVRFFCDHAEAVVFLTATPIQLESDDLFVLLNLLRPDLVIDQESFQHMAAPNPFINRAIDAARGGGDDWQQQAVRALTEAGRTDWGTRILATDPEYQSMNSLLTSGELAPEARVSVIDKLEGMHTFAGIINRTRRRDIGEVTTRDPQTVEVEFTPAQSRLHDSVLEIQARILSRIHPTTSINFMMATIRRQAASCLYGLAPLLKDILNRHIAEIAGQESTDEYDPVSPDVANTFVSEIGEIIELAVGLQDERDPKLEALERVIGDKQALENNKIILFSSFRHTLDYLFEKLSAGGVRVGMVHGGTPDEERISLRDRFKTPREDTDTIDVLLFSEVGCEGLDYQFCDCIVNYDLPWNPMRIEQRIGRIDRPGQRSDKVLIYNFITPGTVDADIYERCLLRIGVFEREVGASEEILGEIAREIRDVAEAFRLTESERKERLKNISDNRIRQIQEQQKLEDKQAEFFGIRLPLQETQKQIDGASSFWLSPDAVQNLVNSYLQRVAGKTRDPILGEKATKTLRVAQEARTRLLKDYQKIPRVVSPTYKQWEDWLKGGDPHLMVTFEAQEAIENQAATFITPLHPLTKQGALTMERKVSAPLCVLKTTDAELPEGIHSFVIYEWKYQGIREDLVFQPVTRSPELSQRLADLMEFARPGTLPEESIPNQDTYDELERSHYVLWTEARARHADETRRIARHRMESLTTSHHARVAMLEDALSQATNEKIRRMRQGQLNNAHADFTRRKDALDEAVRKADLNTEQVAYGVIILTREIDNGQ